MRSKLTILIVGLLLVAGTSLIACSSSDPIPDDPSAEPTEYDSVSDDEDSDYSEYEEAQPPSTQTPQGMGGQSQAGETPQAVGPVATVNGEEIPAERFNQQLAQIEAQSGHLPPELVAHIQDEIIDQLVQQQLLFNAIDEAEIEVTDEQIDIRLEEFREEFQQTTQAQFDEDMDFDEFIAQMGMSPDELREVIEETVAIELLLEAEGMEMPTDEDVRAFYDDNPESFIQPENVEARHILVPPAGQDEQAFEEAREIAAEIHHEITEEGVDFDEAVERRGDTVFSDDAPIARNQPQQPPQIEEAAFALQDGELSEPIRTQQGWLLIHRIEHHEEQMMPFEEVEDQLERELRNQAMEESLQGFLAQLQTDAEIEYHPENIQ